MCVLSSLALQFEAAPVGTAQPYWKCTLLKYVFFSPLKKIETVAGEGIQFALEVKRDVCFSSAPEGSAARPFLWWRRTNY